MNKSAALDRSPVPASADKATHAPLGDDNAMLKAAAGLTLRDLNVARPAVYWADMLGSALLGYAALAATIATGSTIVALISGLIAVLALYRAGSFIHEITHMKPNAVPGFYWTWNALVGVPLLVPSFMYEGVHNQHHAKTYLRDRRRSRISAASTYASLDPSGIPDRRGNGPDRHADPLRLAGAIVAAVAEAA